MTMKLSPAETAPPAGKGTEGSEKHCKTTRGNVITHTLHLVLRFHSSVLLS